MGHEHPNLSQGNLVMDEVNVDLDVLGPTVMNRISCHVNSTDVVTKDNHGGG